MKFILDFLFFLIIVYFSYRFIQVLVKLKKPVHLPTSKEELLALRKNPQKPIDFPTYSTQKLGIIIHACTLLFVITIFIYGSFTSEVNWTLYLLLILPLSHSSDLFNVFAIYEDGILSASRFVSWSKIKSYQFVPIDINHKYYGYDKEVNDGYELLIKIKGGTLSCVVTENEMKEKLTMLLNKYVEKA